MTIATKHPTEPDAAFQAMRDLARTQRLGVPELLQFAEGLAAAGRRGEAAEIYKVWIAYNEAHPHAHLVLFNYSVVLRQLNDIAGSIHALRACLKVDPRFGQAHINLGRAYEDSGLSALAIQQWRAFADLTADSTADKVAHRLMALQHIGRVMENAGLMEEAETALWQAIELRPDKPEAGQHWSALRQRQCKWPILIPSEHAPMRALIDSLSPLALACYADDPLFQLARAYRYNKSFVGRPDISGFPRRPVRQKRARARGSRSATYPPTCATTPSASRCARCWSCMTRPASRSTPIIAATPSPRMPRRPA